MPLVSVVVPTHERARYAIPTINCLLGASDRIQIVVCDTSERDEITSHFASQSGQDERLKIVRPGRKMSVVENFNAGFQAADGDYVCFLGDDDFVTGRIAEVAEWAAANDVDAVKFTFPAYYYWPDFRHASRNDFYAGTLHLNRFSGRVLPHDAREALLKATGNLGGGVMEMPRAYAGLVSRALLQLIEQRYGAVFGGVSPDIYSASLISQSCRRCVLVDYPVIVPGASAASTAGLSASGRHVGALRDNPHIGAFQNLRWDPLVPEFYSVPTVWGYSLAKGVEALGLDTACLNFARLYVKCLIFQRPYFRHTLTCVSLLARKRGWTRVAAALFLGLVGESRWIISKLVQRIRSRFPLPSGTDTKRELADSTAALCALERHLEATGVPLQI